MSRDRRWWGVPRSFAGFSLWRLSNPFEVQEEERAKEGGGSSRCSPEATTGREDSEGREKSRSPSRRLERSPSKRLERSRSRSRSSSFSFKSRKSSERETPEKKEEDVEVRKSVLPDISFTFFSEQDREQEYIVVDHSLNSAVGSNNDEANIQVNQTDVDPNCEAKADQRTDCESRPKSVEDERVKRVEEPQVEEDEVRHVSSVVMSMKPVDYTNMKDLKLAVETVVKENEYEVLKEKVEPPYSSPRVSGVEVIPVYATIVKSNKSSTLDSNETNDFVEALFSIPTAQSDRDSNSRDPEDSRGFREALPAVPPPDWDEVSLNSEFNADYAELTTPVTTPEPTETHRGEPSDKEDLAYCQHRAELKPALRRVTLLRCKKTVRRTPSIGRMKNKLGKAWRRVRGWWVEERIRLNEVILKRDSVREASVVSEAGVRCVSEEDLCGERVRSDEVMSSCSTLPARYMRHHRSPTPVLSRSSSVAAFRRSKFYPEVNPLTDLFLLIVHVLVVR